MDVIATFNIQGRIKPNYIRFEDEDHALQTYRIEEVVFSREEKYAGVPVLFFCCNIIVRDTLQAVNIKYHTKTYQWILENRADTIKYR